MKLTRMTRTAGWLAVAGLLGAAIIGPAATFAKTGPEVAPTLHEGNITACPSGAGSTIYVDANTTTGSAAGVTVSIVYDAGTKSLDFTATGGVVMHAFIKGGDAYNDYDYTPSGIAADDGLVAPDNASGGPAGLSHGIFCVEPTTTTTTTTSSETTSSETTSSETTSSETTSSETTSSETTSSETTSSETTSSETTSSETTSSETTSSPRRPPARRRPPTNRAVASKPRPAPRRSPLRAPTPLR